MDTSKNDPVILAISTRTMTEALSIMEIARRMNIKSSYHPHGGWKSIGRGNDVEVPITHMLWVMGTGEEVIKLRLEMEKIKNE